MTDQTNFQEAQIESTPSNPLSDPNYRNLPQIILISTIFIFQYFSKRNELSQKLNEQQTKLGNKLLWKYIILFQLAKSCDWCLGPFTHEFFSTYHSFSIELTAKMIAVSFASSLFVGPSLIGYLNDSKNKKIPMLMFSVVLSFSCLIRLVQGNLFYVVGSQIAFGVASCILYSSFENWFICEANSIKDSEVKDYILSTAFEKSMVGDAVVGVAISYIAGALKGYFGIKAPYFLSASLCLITFLFIVFTVNSKPSSLVDESELDTKNEEGNLKVQKEKEGSKPTKGNENKKPEISELDTNPDLYELSDVFSNTWKAAKTIAVNPYILLFGITESLLLCILHIFIFTWSPTLKEVHSSADMSHTFSLLMMSLMTGGAAFRTIYSYFHHNIFSVSKTMTFFALIGVFLISLKQNYTTTLVGFILYEISVGLFYPTYSKIKADYLPKSQSGTITNFFKVPFNIVVIILLVTTNQLFSVDGMLKLNLGVAGTVFLLQVLFFGNPKNVVIKQNIEGKQKQG